jgi:hypothetical protein
MLPKIGRNIVSLDEQTIICTLSNLLMERIYYTYDLCFGRSKVPNGPNLTLFSKA